MEGNQILVLVADKWLNQFSLSNSTGTEKKFFNVVTALKINFSVENDSHFMTDVYGMVSFDQ